MTKNIKGFVLGLVLGLVVALSGVGLAQDTTQTADPKEKEACCAMESCCCKGKADSCGMKHESKDHSAKNGCCCCSGDSCNMKAKQKQS